MNAPPNPYDELPYRSRPIEWTAPERLSLASMLHGGPRLRADNYRMLELGCADGANLLPLAYYRRQAEFVGIDSAVSQIAIAKTRKAEIGISNVEFINADFSMAARRISGKFDYIIAHGVFSWVSEETRNALLELCAEHLRQDGLLYLNYNTLPGWNVRGLVREFLLAQTAGTESLGARAHLAQDVSARIVAHSAEGVHPFLQLMADEFRFVCENDLSYVAHEYLAVDNHRYWRSDFMALARQYGFEYVADADFNYGSGRLPDDLTPRLKQEQITGRAIEDTVDLLCYRQLHSPILTKGPLVHRRPDVREFGNLLVSSCLTPCAPTDSGNPMFQHPSGYQVEAKDDVMCSALENLHPRWPQGLPVDTLFPDVGQVMEDLELLQRNGLIELRCVDPAKFDVSPILLNHAETGWGDYITTAYHTRESLPADSRISQIIGNVQPIGRKVIEKSRKTHNPPLVSSGP